MDNAKRLKLDTVAGWLPFIVVTAVSLAGVLLIIFSGFSPVLLVVLMAFAILFLYWILMIIRSLMLLRWRSLFLIILAGILQICVVFGCIRSGYEIRFQIMRPMYLLEVARDSPHPQIKDWDWGGTDNFNDTLVYMNGTSIASSGYENNSDGYKSTVTRLSRHFYLVDTTW